MCTATVTLLIIRLLIIQFRNDSCARYRRFHAQVAGRLRPLLPTLLPAAAQGLDAEHRDSVYKKHARNAAKSCVNNPPLQKARHRMQLPECTFSDTLPLAPNGKGGAVAPASFSAVLPTVAYVLEQPSLSSTAAAGTGATDSVDSASRKANLHRQLRAEGIIGIGIDIKRGLPAVLEAMLEAPSPSRAAGGDQTQAAAPFLLLDVDGSGGLGCGFRARLTGVLGSADGVLSGSGRCGFSILGPRGSGVLLLSGGSTVTHADTMPNRFEIPLQPQSTNETACFNLAASDNGQNCIAGLYSRAALEALVRWHRDYPTGTACDGLLHISDLGHSTRVLTPSATMQAHRAVAGVEVDGGATGGVEGCRSTATASPLSITGR